MLRPGTKRERATSSAVTDRLSAPAGTGQELLYALVRYVEATRLHRRRNPRRLLPAFRMRLITGSALRSASQGSSAPSSVTR